MKAHALALAALAAHGDFFGDSFGVPYPRYKARPTAPKPKPDFKKVRANAIANPSSAPLKRLRDRKKTVRH